MSFRIEQPREVIIYRGHPIVLDSVRVLNGSFNNLSTILGGNYYDPVIKQFSVKVLGLVKKKEFFPMTTRRAMKKLKKVYLAKVNFIIH